MYASARPSGRVPPGWATAYARALRLVVSWHGDVAPISPKTTALTSGSSTRSAQPPRASALPWARPLSQAYQARATRSTSSLRVRGRRRRAAVLRVDRPPCIEQRLSLAPHACHVTRDVEADRSRRGVARESQRAACVERLDVAVAVALVAEAVAAAEARDVLQLVAVLDRIAVKTLDLAGPRELGKLPLGQRLDLVADLVGGHRRGCSASCRPGLPRGDRGDRGGARPVQEYPALHRSVLLFITDLPAPGATRPAAVPPASSSRVRPGPDRRSAHRG